ncbi:extracellular solute-binding protein [Catenulispora subtropica]|uniref:Extracellular solute-binding protein n=1 Tax=Catenulispora subtropica TaxID=450798 RepID=A0ABN2QG86_9ACTN
MSHEISRRNVLRTTGAVAVAAAAAPALAACGSSKTGGSSGGAQSNVGKKLVEWPTYTPVKGLNPDMPGTAAGVQDTFLQYPSNLVQSVPTKPGDGSKVRALIVTYGTQPKGPDENKLWKAVNDAVGVDLELTMVTDGDWQTKLGAMMAGSDLPDIIMLGLYQLPNEAQFLQAKCEPLGQYLAGDKGAKDFPNLAAIPHFSWDSMGRVGGDYYGIPIHRPRLGNSFFANSDLFEQAGIWNPTPGGLKKEELTAGLVKLNTQGHFALGTNKVASFGYLNHSGTHGTPNLWSLQNGQFTTAYGTDGMKQSIATMADWYSKGLYDPAALTVSSTQCKTNFQNGTYVTTTDGFGGFTGYANAVNEKFKTDFVRPFDTGAKPTPWLTPGYFGYTVLKKAAPERIKMLLGVLNFLAAPFGSKEWELINYGIEGTHFTRGKDGGPSVPTELGKIENAVNVPFKYVMAAPLVNYIAGQPEAAKRCYKAQQDIVPLGVADPSLGIQSATRNKQWPTLLQQMQDGLNQIITGKAPLSSWDDVIKKWKGNGGDQIAAELGAEYAKTHG